ncbi:MAG: hypothetical protein H0W78_01910 [Planctomycetes bacterium]|nr:hypothetical protein [Planctomycetota bacterium]
MRTLRRTPAWAWASARCVAALLLVGGTVAGEPATSRVTYNAFDQEAAAMIAALGTLSGERYQPDVELLVAGINRTQATLCLIDARPDACRQAVAFALDCWWARDAEGGIVLLTGDRLPQGPMEVRTLTSTLRRQPQIQPLIERLLAPWLGGPAGVSYLPSEGLWSATLDSEGHRRLVELLSLYERPTAQAVSRVADPATPDPRRLTARDLSARSWPALVEGLAQAVQAPVALSPRLRLRVFPPAGVPLPRQLTGQVADALRALGIAAFWCQGVLCLGEPSLPKERIERQHPAQRRSLGIIPIGHLLGSAIDGDLVVATLRRQVAARWWEMPGAGIEFLPESGVLLVAADADVQQAVLDAVAAIDALGLELGLQTIAGGAR